MDGDIVSEPVAPTPREILLSATGAWVWDLAGERVWGDARFANLHGLDPAVTTDGVGAEALFAQVHPDDRLRLRIAIAGARYGAELFSRDYRVAAEDGVRWISARGRAEHPADGGPPRFSGVAVDITEQKRVEERLRIAQSAGGVGTFEYIEGFGTATVSDQFCRLLGLHQAEALPVRTINSVVEPGEAPIIRPLPASRAAGTIHAEVRIRRADTQERRWIAVRGERRRDSEHSGVRFIGVIYDVTDTKANEAKLEDLARTLEERVEARTQERDRLWNSSRDLFAVLSSDGSVSSINPAWSQVLGYGADEVIGRPLQELIDPEEAAALGSSGVAGLDELDTRVLAKDGGQRWINWRAIPFGDSWYAIGRDVTERKQLEEELRQSQKMEAVGQLTGGIAHDFNNMLTAVLGGLDVVKGRIETGRVAEAGRFIEAATASAERAAGLTQRLLAFSRRQTLDPRPVDVNALVTSIEDLLRRTLGVQVDLEVSISQDLWRALTDANQLENAILNLAINARDAMSEGGQLTIETANARLDERYASRVEGLAPGDYVEVSVSDTGMGMAPEVLARAFDPFFTTKPLGQGTGLGLSMVYGFVRQSGGAVAIFSEPGVGTTVKLYLPRADVEEAVATQDHAVAAPEGAGETVLVVEDDAAVRAVVVAVLHELGYRLVEAAEADAALRILETPHKLDLLVTDVGLPGLNGRQLAEIARQRRPDLPVLFITGYAAGAARRSELVGPGMEMISKPFAVEAFAQKVREMLEA